MNTTIRTKTLGISTLTGAAVILFAASYTPTTHATPMVFLNNYKAAPIVLVRGYGNRGFNRGYINRGFNRGYINPGFNRGYINRSINRMYINRGFNRG